MLSRRNPEPTFSPILEEKEEQEGSEQVSLFEGEEEEEPIFEEGSSTSDDPDYEGSEYNPSPDYTLNFFPKINPMGPGRSLRQGLGDLSSESASSLSISPLSSISSRGSKTSNSPVSTLFPISSVSSRGSKTSNSPVSTTSSLPIQLKSQIPKQANVNPPTLQLNEEQLKSLGEQECKAAGRIYRKKTDKRKSVCAKSPKKLKNECEQQGLLYRKASRVNGKVVRKATCVSPKSPKTNIIFAEYDEGDNDKINNNKNTCTENNLKFRSQYTTKKNGTFVAARCVKAKSKSPNKKAASPKKAKSPKKKAASPKKAKSPKKKAASPKKAKSPKKKAASPKKKAASPKKAKSPGSKARGRKTCPSGKSPRVGHIRNLSSGKTKKIAATCVTKR